ncbi:hypothetical protein GP486_001863 [Trichoglossum hirsutum]|uniref:Uncharacterized protein n=1 Tax=Trichoglossum hirsutum TaxID=265104 RepID=A0A9P8LGB6_9PEZI|nr:hypothetical protein GP486_001863 [Trichoglossum hirsutum]
MSTASEKLPVIAALDELSQEPFFIKQLVNKAQVNSHHGQDSTISIAKIRSVFDELIGADYVAKVGRKYMTTTKLQDAISEIRGRPNQPASGFTGDRNTEMYTAVVQMLESNTGNCSNTSDCHDVDGDRPLAVRRKRRSSVSRLALTTGENAGDTIQISQDNAARIRATPTSTPRKLKKRVRFSDPGPATASTGLTPAIDRCSIKPEVHIMTSRSSSTRKTSKTPRRRRSLPARLPAAPLPDFVPPTPISGEIQFVSLRQVLQPRVQRLLWRKNLSEQMNEIEMEKKAAAKQQRNTEKNLKERLEAKDKQLGELLEEIEITRQLAIDVAPTMSQDADRDQTVMDLKEEIARLREEIETHQEKTVDSNAITTGWGEYDDDGDDFMMVTQDDFDNDITRGSPAGLQCQPSPAPDRTASAVFTGHKMTEVETQTDLPNIEHEELHQQVEDLKAKLESLNRLLESDNEDRQRFLSKLHRFVPQSDQTNLDATLDMVLTQLVIEQSRSGDAQAALHALSSDISLLGFEGEGVEDMLNTIRHQFRQARLELEYLSPGENIDGFENAKLLSMLIERIRVLMKEVRDGNEELKSQAQREALLRVELGGMNGHLMNAGNKIGELETDLDEKERSIGKLQRALDGYRDEVNGLETLIGHLDSEHQAAVSKLQREMDEAVHDLEGRVSEETTRRQSMEDDIRGKRALIAQLEAKVVATVGHLEEINAELRITKAEKDGEIRRLENEYRELDEKSRGDINRLDGHIAELQLQIQGEQSRLAEARTSIADLTASKSDLEARLVEEVKRGIHALEALQAGMRITMAEKEEVVQKLESRIRELDSEYLNDICGRDTQIAELQGQIKDMQAMLSEAQGSISSLSASKYSLETRLAKEVDSHIHDVEAAQAEMCARISEKELSILRLECEKKELSDRHQNDLANRDSSIKEMRHQARTIQDALADARLSVRTLTASKTTLETLLAEERENGMSAVTAMRGEIARSLTSIGDIGDKYLKVTKPQSSQLPGNRTDDHADDKQHAGLPHEKGRGRRRYDSGIGVSEDEHEGMCDDMGP